MINKAIEIINLEKKYKDLVALNKINLSIPKGSFFGLLGPNGAGKTTTINIITGLVKIKSGNVKVMGYDVITQYQKSRKTIGLAPQEFNFDHFFPLHHLLTLQAGYYGIKKSFAEHQANVMLKQFGLESKANSTPRQLSGGMKRRLQIAKALVHNPDIVILDEPTAGVDLELRYMLWEYLSKINKQGKTILLTTHYIDEAEYLCKDIAIIDNGHIITAGNTKELIKTIGKSSIKIKIPNWKNNAILDEWESIYKDGFLFIYTKEPEKNMSKIIQILSTSEFTIEEIFILKTSLEDVFVKLTGKSIND